MHLNFLQQRMPLVWSTFPRSDTTLSQTVLGITPQLLENDDNQIIVKAQLPALKPKTEAQ